MSFQKVYPFTTEDISGYLTQIDVENKKVLTVGSSGDQALNSLLLGAKEVTIFDINKTKEKFFKQKKDIILNSSREQLYQRILNLKEFDYFEDIFLLSELEKMNLYMNSDENYKKLQQKLINSKISFATGDIFDIKNSDLKEYNFDVMILSNVMQYLQTQDDKVSEEVYNIYLSLTNYLNKNGVIQLYYLYGSIYPKSFSKIINHFLENDVLLEKINCNNSKDSVILTRSRKY